jgi:hypothetical protein
MNSIAIRIGLFMLAGFIALFLLLNTFGLGYRYDSRIFFGVGFIHLLGMYLSINAYYKEYPEEKDGYGVGVWQGIMTSVIGVVGLTLFITTFLWLDPNLMDAIRQNSPMGQYLSPFSTSLVLFSGGLAVSLVGSYILTRIVRVDD